MEKKPEESVTGMVAEWAKTMIKQIYIAEKLPAPKFKSPLR